MWAALGWLAGWPLMVGSVTGSVRRSSFKGGGCRHRCLGLLFSFFWGTCACICLLFWGGELRGPCCLLPVCAPCPPIDADVYSFTSGDGSTEAEGWGRTPESFLLFAFLWGGAKSKRIRKRSGRSSSLIKMPIVLLRLLALHRFVGAWRPKSRLTEREVSSLSPAARPPK